MNCVSFEIAIFSQSQFAIFRNPFYIPNCNCYFLVNFWERNVVYNVEASENSRLLSALETKDAIRSFINDSCQISMKSNGNGMSLKVAKKLF